MQNVPDQTQIPSESESGYAPVLPPEYSSSQQQLYQPAAPSSQGQQQQYWTPPVGMVASGDVSAFERTSMGMRARTAGVLSYLAGSEGWCSSS